MVTHRSTPPKTIVIKTILINVSFEYHYHYHQTRYLQHWLDHQCQVWVMETYLSSRVLKAIKNQVALIVYENLAITDNKKETIRVVELKIVGHFERKKELVGGWGNFKRKKGADLVFDHNSGKS